MWKNFISDDPFKVGKQNNKMFKQYKNGWHPAGAMWSTFMKDGLFWTSESRFNSLPLKSLQEPGQFWI